MMRRRPSLAGSESSLYVTIAQYLNMQYPGLLYHFDLSGVNNPSIATRALYSRLNGRAFPDLIIYEPRKGFSGLALEIKKDTSSQLLKDGTVRISDEHIKRQQEVLDAFKARGYAAEFGVGFDRCREIIDNYLT